MWYYVGYFELHIYTNQCNTRLNSVCIDTHDEYWFVKATYNILNNNNMY